MEMVSAIGKLIHTPLCPKNTGKKYIIAKDGQPGPVTTQLYNHWRAIQLGDEPDVHNWVTILD